MFQTLVIPKFFSDGLSVYAASITELNTVQQFLIDVTNVATYLML